MKRRTQPPPPPPASLSPSTSSIHPFPLVLPLCPHLSTVKTVQGCPACTPPYNDHRPATATAHATATALQPSLTCIRHRPATATALQPQTPIALDIAPLPLGHRSFWFRFWLCSQSMNAIADSLALVGSAGLRSWLIHTHLTQSITDLGFTCSNP
jgi:hypothetical protein